MCGILGYSAATRPSPDFMRGFTRLFELNSSRGTHASGVAWDHGSGLGLFKLPVASVELVRLRRYGDFTAERPLEAVAHARWATQGGPENPLNNHPHVGFGGRLALVHNGHVANWAELAREKGLRLRGECDSEVLARIVERGLVGKQGLAEAVGRAGRAGRGGRTFAALLAGKGVVVFKRLNPLAYARMGDATVFSSDSGHIEKAFGVGAREIGEGQALVARNGEVELQTLLEVEKPAAESGDETWYSSCGDGRPGWYRGRDGKVHFSSWGD